MAKQPAAPKRQGKPKPPTEKIEILVDTVCQIWEKGAAVRRPVKAGKKVDAMVGDARFLVRRNKAKYVGEDPDAGQGQLPMSTKGAGAPLVE